MSTIPSGTSPPDGRSKAIVHALWANHAVAMIALVVAGFVLVSSWHEQGAVGKIHMLNVGVWGVFALGSGVQLLLRPARGDVLLSLAAVMATAGGSCMATSYLVAREGMVIGLRIGSIIALVVGLALFTLALLRRRHRRRLQHPAA